MTKIPNSATQPKTAQPALSQPPKRAPGPGQGYGRANAARVSRGSVEDYWPGLATQPRQMGLMADCGEQPSTSLLLGNGSFHFSFLGSQVVLSTNPPKSYSLFAGGSRATKLKAESLFGSLLV